MNMSASGELTSRQSMDIDACYACSDTASPAASVQGLAGPALS